MHPWYTELGMVDKGIEGGRIFAYSILYNGYYSDKWYVPYLNDQNDRYNPSAVNCTVPGKTNTMRRQWFNFYNYWYSLIICKPN
ncbi:hypothetical protein DPMN_187010 [Dreissena polymorpha]|uniref:Uncharacterized protein n=1 Tax=Dreissena polymorpha TaxID=45954 RepID=A0A9D4I9X5_DREPO|nr:hypothetical protein DPMN_187010 [Dreissena polymorpha]